MNVDRLTRLAALLDRVQAEKRRFNISQWHTERDCGTTACALGWAALDHSFQAEGLYLDVFEMPEFNQKVGIRAGAAFFDISLRQSDHLFSPDCYPEPLCEVTSADVAARVLELLATGETA